jgi:RNA polymerase sigma-70 factor, ECF subfamily
MPPSNPSVTPLDQVRAGRTAADRSGDAELVRRCLSGDLGAFELLYQRHAGRLYTLACRMLGNPTDAEDLLQEIFLVAYRKLGSFKGDAALSTWLYRLAMNQCLDHLRSRAARAGRLTTSLEDDDGHWRPQPGVRPRERAVTRLDLERAIGALPDGCRAAFLLHDVEGFEHREVADILGIAEGTSKSQVHKARLRLRRTLSGP